MDESELIGGIEHRPIVIVDYQPEWAVRFLAEQERIHTALGSNARRIEHIGSTAVPGLSAKPIIDIQVSVPDVGDEPAYLPPLIAAGYVLRVRQPGHRMVRTPQIDVHAHVCTEGGAWERRHLLFRDWLRFDESDREAYAELKRDLASRDWPDVNAYAAAKGPLISSITARAEAWAQDTGWSLDL